MISAIVLAAGRSKRMGRCKPLLPYGNRTVIEQIVFTLFKTGVDETIVVTGCDGDLVQEVLTPLPVRVIHNFDYKNGGMLSSIKTGLRTASLGGTRDKNDAGTGYSEGGAVLFCLGDQPAIEGPAVARLVSAYKKAKKKKILIPSCGGRAGHPILVPDPYWRRILDLPLDQSLRDVTRDPETAVQYVEFETDSILQDMNTPEDYERETKNL